jgi:cytochrome c oxidase subunit IV
LADKSSETTGTTETAARRISSFVLVVIFVTLALSLVALYFSMEIYPRNEAAAGYFLLIGFIGLALSSYMLLQMRKRVLKWRLKLPPIMTIIECQKCGFKNVREFKRGDYVFKQMGACEKCNEPVMITGIYREIKEQKKKEEKF